MTAAEIPAEIESKLAAPDAATLRAIARRGELGPFRLLPLGTQRLRTTYLDTSGWVLARHGMALRVRRAGGSWEVTLKWSGRVKGDLHQRPELTLALSKPPQFPFDTSRDPQLHRHLAALTAGRPLLPILETDIRRQRLDLQLADGDTVISCAEVALDEVVIRAPGSAAVLDRFCEVEIERTNGTTRDVRRAAAVLKDELGLVASTTTKFGRGLSLLRPRSKPKADRGPATEAESPATVVRRVIASELRKLRAADPGIRSGDDPEDLHDARVALRRTRTALRTLGAVIPSSVSTSLGAELRWLAGVMGVVREWDVLLTRIDEFAAEAPTDMRAPLDQWRGRMVDLRQQAHADLVRQLDSRRCRRLLLSLERLAEKGWKVAATASEVSGFAGPELRRRWRKLQPASRGEGEPTPEHMHRLRIRAKRLRYLLEFYAKRIGKPGRRILADLVEIQGVLGAYHDAEVAAAALRTLLAPTLSTGQPDEWMALGALVGAELRSAQAARRRFLRVWKRLKGRKPRRRIEQVADRLDATASASQTPAPDPAEDPASSGGDPLGGEDHRQKEAKGLSED